MKQRVSLRAINIMVGNLTLFEKICSEYIPELTKVKDNERGILEFKRHPSLTIRFTKTIKDEEIGQAKMLFVDVVSGEKVIRLVDDALIEEMSLETGHVYLQCMDMIKMISDTAKEDWRSYKFVTQYFSLN